MGSKGRSETRTGGRAATTGVILGDYALSVGMPSSTLPEGWRWTRLTDVARLETGHTPSRKHPEYWGGDIPWIGTRDATANHGCTLYRTNQYTNDLGIANSSARVLPANTVCLSRTASVGYVVVMGRPMATSQDFVNWVCSGSLDFRYLKYVLLAERESFLRFASGTTHQTIYFPEVKAFHAALPPFSEQERIAETLSALDDRIDLLRQTNATLEAIAQALFKSWFVDFDPVRAKAEGREPEGMDTATAALFPSEFEESELGLIPKGWRVLPLSEAFEINPRRSIKKGSIAPYLDMASVPTSGHVPVPPVSREFSSGSKFQNGDTLLARITPCLENGKTAHVDFLADEQVGWGSTEFIVLRPKPPLPLYFGYLIARHDAFRTFATQAMTGTSGRQRVELGQLERFQVVCPEVPVSDAFGLLVEPIRACIFANQQRSEVLATLRDTLLPRLISGRLRLPEAEKSIEGAVA